jgi:hypothetical protein
LRSNKIVLSNKSTINSFDENETFLTAKFLVCDFSVNRNGVMLNRRTINNWINTLVGQPVLGKLGVYDDNGQIVDFTSHNDMIQMRQDENGNIYSTDDFDTCAIGVFTDVSINEIDGNECIIGTAHIWKRFHDFCAVLRRRASDENKPVNTSWEILVKASHNTIIGGQPVEVIDDGAFLGHCILSQITEPAYPNSRLLSVAAKKDIGDYELFDALKRDVSVLRTKQIAESSDGVVPKNISTKKADEDTTWTAPTLSDFTDKKWSELTDDEKTKIAEHYAWAKAVPPDKFSDLKLPHHQASDGKVVLRAVENASARLNQTDIPDGIVDKVKSHLEAHYHQFDKKAPWEEDSKMKNDDKPETTASDNTTVESNKSKVKVSELTDHDIHKKLYDAIADKLNCGIYDVNIIFVIATTNTVWVQRWGDDDLSVKIFTYKVDGKNNTVTVSDPVDGKLSVSVDKINDTISDYKGQIAKLNSSIVKANSTVQNLNKQVAELKPYKEAADQAEANRIEAETVKKRDAMKKYALNSGLISKSELESDKKIKTCIDNVCKKDLDSIIADRFIKSLDKKSSVETSSKKAEVANVKHIISDVSEKDSNFNDDEEDYVEIMSKYING